MSARRRRERRSALSTLAVFSIACFFSTTPCFGQDEDELPIPELELPKDILEDLSVWQQHAKQAENDRVDKRTRGVFPIGDGYVFTYLGLGRRANTMQALTGPHYQTEEVNAPKGHYGELTLDLLQDGKFVALPTQSVWRTRGANFVLTEDGTERPEDADAELSLYTVNWATRGHRTLYRWVEVRNRSKSPRKLTLRATWERGSADPSGKGLVAKYTTGRFADRGFEAHLSASRDARASGKQLDVALGAIPAGQAVTVVLALRTKSKGNDFGSKVPTEADAAAAFDDCEKHWRQRLISTATVASDNKRVADLLEDWKVLMLTQRSEPSGAVSPMINYRGSWIRDNNGPLLAFLRYGLFSEARDLLDYVYDATVCTGRLNNHVPLDVDVSKARDIEKTIHWGKVQIPNGELPCWIILQHEWYYRATYDIDFVRKRWPFISACYRAIKPDKFGTLPTNGDETYLHGAFFSLWPDRLPKNAFLPADSPERRARSFDTSILYLIAINAMGEMIEDIERTASSVTNTKDFVSRRRQAYEGYHLDMLQKIERAFWQQKEKRFAPFLSPITGEPHTAPYGPVSLRPNWLGFTYAMGEHNKENLESSLNALWQKNGRIGMTPTVGHSVGHLQGYLLYNLADLDDGRRHEVINNMLDLAGPAGEWAELYDDEGRPIGGYNKEWPNRCRPWESGINIDALFFALNGVRYACCPGWSKKDQRLKFRTPPGAKWLTMKHNRHDGHLFHVYLDEVFVKDLKLDSTGKPVSKMRFRLVYDRINEDVAGLKYVDTAINVGETLYVRYPTLKDPVNEQDVWPVDKESFFKKHDGPGKFDPRPLQVPAGTKAAILTTRMANFAMNGHIIDVGLPMRPEHYAALFADDGKRKLDTVMIDVGAEESSRLTFKKAGFFNGTRVTNAKSEFAKLGGRLIEPAFIRDFSVVGPFPAANADALDTALQPEEANNFRAGQFDSKGVKISWKTVRSPASRFDLLRAFGTGDGLRMVGYAATTLQSDRAVECTLKVGSDDGVKVWVNGKNVLTRKVLRTAVPDQDEVLIRLNKGENRILFKVYNDGGGCFLYARVTDTDGVPLQGVVAK